MSGKNFKPTRPWEYEQQHPAGGNSDPVVVPAEVLDKVQAAYDALSKWAHKEGDGNETGAVREQLRCLLYETQREAK